MLFYIQHTKFVIQSSTDWFKVIIIVWMSPNICDSVIRCLGDNKNYNVISGMFHVLSMLTLSSEGQQYYANRSIPNGHAFTWAYYNCTRMFRLHIYLAIDYELRDAAPESCPFGTIFLYLYLLANQAPLWTKYDQMPFHSMIFWQNYFHGTFVQVMWSQELILWKFYLHGVNMKKIEWWTNL